MAKRKPKEKSEEELIWELYQSLQLTPEQKAAARAEVEKDAEKAARDGVFERMLELQGKVEIGEWWWQMRGKPHP